MTILNPAQRMIRWSLPPKAELAWRGWKGELVVHHALSNDTHRFAEPAGSILRQLGQYGPQDQFALATMCGADEADCDEVLAALASMNLVVRC